eukprot:TRINITY_DN17428_c0_g1_i1.p1 TRINITY_DN17428_c0_g1~~TRINITY_DN17428_c0_g1_i1.p1  ORF type:complete len:297 (-),score=54.22 TRINITY_DN17428_c0_g1_i1:540-1409(-)
MASKSSSAAMEEEDDHYKILGLPSGEEGAKLSQAEIKKAYKAKARECHPDKRPDDPLAKSAFQKLQSSFDILKNEAARKAFDDLLRLRQDRIRRETHIDSKRRKMMFDLQERERAAFAVYPREKAREEEREAAKKFREEVASIRAMHAKKTEVNLVKEVANSNKARSLKVYWERDGEDYSDLKLRELFGRFGTVEEVVMGSILKKRKTALIVMASRLAVVAATQSRIEGLSNPLTVLPCLPFASDIPSHPPTKNAEPDTSKPNISVSAKYQAYEDSILAKLRKAAETQK